MIYLHISKKNSTFTPKFIEVPLNKFDYNELK